MKKVIFIVCIFASLIISKKASDKKTSLVISNIEALAQNEGGGFLPKCYLHVSSVGGYPSSSIRYCGGCTELWTYIYTNESICF